MTPRNPAPSQRSAALPIRSDVSQALERLEREERELVGRLAEAEERLRRFREEDRPAYDAWLRLEFGPRFSLLEELMEGLRLKRILVQRIRSLMEERGLHAREALFAATRGPEPESEFESGTEEEAGSQSNGGNAGWDPDEIEARRRAKREAKREARKAAKNERKREKAQEAEPEEAAASPRRKLISIYRALARRLHPDAAGAETSERTHRLWLEVQAAYEAADYERLLSVAAWLEADGGGANSAGAPAPRRSLEERIERNRSLKRSAAKLARELAKLAGDPAWNFIADASSRKQLRKTAAAEIDAEIARMQEALGAYEDFIDSIGPPRPPRTPPAGRRASRAGRAS